MFIAGSLEKREQGGGRGVVVRIMRPFTRVRIIAGSQHVKNAPATPPEFLCSFLYLGETGMKVHVFAWASCFC